MCAEAFRKSRNDALAPFVERMLGQGVNARATVLFEHAGPKQLLLQYAKLELELNKLKDQLGACQTKLQRAKAR